MLGEFISRCLLMFFGYAYPAFECYKTVEKNRIEIQELRLWCQYWIIVAILTFFERIGDVFLSWLPMYGFMKVAFVIYLWHPNTKGTEYVFEMVLRPYIAKHETEIEQRLMEWRARGLDLAIFYWENFSQLIHFFFFQLLHYFSSHTTNLRNQFIQINGQEVPTEPPPPPEYDQPSYYSKQINQTSKRKKRGSSAPPHHADGTDDAIPEAHRSDVVQDAHLHSQSEYVDSVEAEAKRSADKLT